MRMLKNAFAALLMIAVVIFAVANMQAVAINLDPFGLDIQLLQPIFMPLAFVILCALGAGMVVGAVLMRLTAWSIYGEHRRQTRELDTLRSENRRLQATLKAADHPDSAGLPALRR